MRKRIMEDTTELPDQRAVAYGDVGSSFEASLAAHLTFFQWCEQNWRWFVREMEERVRKSVAKAKSLPVDGMSPPKNTPPKPPEDGSSSDNSDLHKQSIRVDYYISRARDILRDLSPFSQRPTQRQTDEPGSSIPQVPNGMRVLNMFNYKDLQSLSKLGDRLEEVILVLQLDIKALEDVYAYYQRLTGCHDVEGSLKLTMEKSIPAFQVRLRRTITSLETRHTQLVSLRKRLDEGKALVSDWNFLKHQTSE